MTADLQEICRNLWLYEVAESDIVVRGALIVGERYAAVWDSLAHPDDVAAISTYLGNRPFYLVYSHADWDHCWGTAGFANLPECIVAHAECRRRFQHDVPATLTQYAIWRK